MAMQYVVKQIGECPECAGKGWIQNPQWLELGVKYPHGASYEQINEYFGFEQEVYRWPPEQLDCAECEAMGRIEREVSLLDALRELGFEEGK